MMTPETGIVAILATAAVFVVAVAYSVCRISKVLAQKAEQDWQRRTNEGPYGNLPTKDGPYS